MKATKNPKRPGRGRPKNIDPPKLFSTTLPVSAYELLTRLADFQHRTKSAILADAIEAYARRFQKFIEPM